MVGDSRQNSRGAVDEAAIDEVNDSRANARGAVDDVNASRMHLDLPAAEIAPAGPPGVTGSFNNYSRPKQRARPPVLQEPAKPAEADEEEPVRDAVHEAEDDDEAFAPAASRSRVRRRRTRHQDGTAEQSRRKKRKRRVSRKSEAVEEEKEEASQAETERSDGSAKEDEGDQSAVEKLKMAMEEVLKEPIGEDSQAGSGDEAPGSNAQRAAAPAAEA
jgi:hypothetical protein